MPINPPQTPFYLVIVTIEGFRRHNVELKVQSGNLRLVYT